MGIGRNAFKIWLTASICWIVAVGIGPYAGGLFPAHYQTEFPLRPGLEPWQPDWRTSDPLRRPLYEIIRSPSAENLPLTFRWRGYGWGAQWNQHIHAREMPRYRFPSSETLDLPAELTEADRDYVQRVFWDQRWRRWKETLGPFARTAIFLPLGALVVLWLVPRLKIASTGKEPEPEVPRPSYSPGMERLRNITLAASGAEILCWIVIGVLNERDEPQLLLDAASLMFVVMLPAIAAFILSLLRRGPLTAAVLAGLALTMLLPELLAHIVPTSWLVNTNEFR